MWYCEIKEATQLSDEALDTKYLSTAPKSGKRRRLFQRIRSVGSNPDRERVDIGNKPVFNRVHGDSTPALDIASENFRSLLWNMLAEPGYAQREFSNVIDSIVASRGWYRASSEDIALGLHFIADDPAFGRHTDSKNVYSAMLTSLESEPCADNIALLGALFHEAILAVDLETAAALRDSLLTCATLWMVKIGWWDTNAPFEEDVDRHWFPHGRVFEHLIDRRVVRNDWTKPKIDRRAHRNQRQYIQALLQANARRPVQEGLGPSRHPIVLRSPRIEWLQKNRETLGKVRQKLAWANDQAQFRDSLNPKQRKFAQRCMEYGNKLRALIHPPARDTRHCLPVRRNRGPRDANRAAPYLINGTLDESGLFKAPREEALTIGKKSIRGDDHFERDEDAEPFEC